MKDLSQGAFLWALVMFGVVGLVLYAEAHNAATLKETLDAVMRDETLRSVAILILMQPVVFGVLYFLKKRSNHNAH